MKNIIEITHFFELKEDFTKNDLKSAYAKKIKENHPEDFPNEFIEIQNMYEYALEYLNGDINLENILDLEKSNSFSNLEDDSNRVKPYDYFSDLFSKYKTTYKSFENINNDSNVEIEFNNNDIELIKEVLKKSVSYNYEIINLFDNLNYKCLIYLHKIISEINYSKSYRTVYYIFNQEQIRNLYENEKNFRFIINKYFYYNIFDFDLRTSKYICTNLADYNVIEGNLRKFLFSSKKTLDKLKRLDLNELIYLNEVICDFHYNNYITYTCNLFRQTEFLEKLQNNDDFLFLILKYFKLNYHVFSKDNKKYIIEEAKFIAPHFKYRRLFLKISN